MQLIHLCAPNDRDGNPQRAWVGFNESGIACEYFAEGYSGTAAVPDSLRMQRLAAPSIRVSAAELRTWEKAAEANKAAMQEVAALAK